MEHTRQKLDEIIEELTRCPQVKASAVIGKSGIMASCCMPHVSNKETFGAMAATMFGAADLASSESGIGTVTRVTVHSEHGTIITEDAGSNTLLSVMTEKNEKENLIPQIEDKVQQIRSIVKGI